MTPYAVYFLSQEIYSSFEQIIKILCVLINKYFDVIHWNFSDLKPNALFSKLPSPTDIVHVFGFIFWFVSNSFRL